MASSSAALGKAPRSASDTGGPSTAVMGSANDPNHKGLSCLSDHHLGYYANRIEQNDNLMLSSDLNEVSCSHATWAALWA